MIQNLTHQDTNTASQKLPLDPISLICDYFTDSIGNTVVENHVELKRTIFVTIKLHFIDLPSTSPHGVREEKDVGI